MAKNNDSILPVSLISKFGGLEVATPAPNVGKDISEEKGEAERAIVGERFNTFFPRGTHRTGTTAIAQTVADVSCPTSAESDLRVGLREAQGQDMERKVAQAAFTAPELDPEEDDRGTGSGNDRDNSVHDDDSQNLPLAKSALARLSPLLALPSELRNQVYENYAAVVAEKPFKINRHGAAVPPALLQTCTQIRKELTPVVDQDVADRVHLVAYVYDFDFSHVLDFLKRLAPLDKGEERDLKIYIEVSEDKKVVPEHLIKQWTEPAQTVKARCKPKGPYCATTIFGMQLRIFYQAVTTWRHVHTGEQSYVLSTDRCGCIQMPGSTDDLLFGAQPLTMLRRAVDLGHVLSLRQQTPLLGLPTLVRFQIYRHCWDSLPVLTIDRSGDYVLLGLTYVSRAIRREISASHDTLSALEEKGLQTVVYNLDFRHILAFVKKLQAAAVNTLSPPFIRMTATLKQTKLRVGAREQASLQDFCKLLKGCHRYTPADGYYMTAKTWPGDVSIYIRFSDRFEQGLNYELS